MSSPCDTSNPGMKSKYHLLNLKTTTSCSLGNPGLLELHLTSPSPMITKPICSTLRNCREMSMRWSMLWEMSCLVCGRQSANKEHSYYEKSLLISLAYRSGLYLSHSHLLCSILHMHYKDVEYTSGYSKL